MAKKKDSRANPGDAERKKEKAKLLQKNKQERAGARLIQQVKLNPDKHKQEYEKYERLANAKKLDHTGKKRWAELQKLKTHIDYALETRRQGELIAMDRSGRREEGNLAELAAQARDHRRRGDDTFDASTVMTMARPPSISSSESYEYYSESDGESYEEYSDPLPPEGPPPGTTVLPPPTEVMSLHPDPSLAETFRPEGSYPPVPPMKIPEPLPTSPAPYIPPPSLVSPPKPSTPAFAPVSVMVRKKQEEKIKSFAEPMKAQSLVGLETNLLDDAFGTLLPPKASSLGGLKRLKRKPANVTSSPDVPPAVTSIATSSCQDVPKALKSLGLGDTSADGAKKAPPSEADLDALFESFLE